VNNPIHHLRRKVRVKASNILPFLCRKMQMNRESLLEASMLKGMKFFIQALP
jgi:hypothetical protein